MAPTSWIELTATMAGQVRRLVVRAYAVLLAEVIP